MFGIWAPCILTLMITMCKLNFPTKFTAASRTLTIHICGGSHCAVDPDVADMWSRVCVSWQTVGFQVRGCWVPVQRIPQPHIARRVPLMLTSKHLSPVWMHMSPPYSITLFFLFCALLHDLLKMTAVLFWLTKADISPPHHRILFPTSCF